MAHLESFTKADAKKVLREYFRELQDYKNNVNKDLSSENYCFCDSTSSKELFEKINLRVNTIMQGRDIQKQTNIIGTWVITCPEEFVGDKDMEKAFFTHCYQFCKDRYGEANVMGGFIHNDETTPHMHVVVVPEAESRKTHKVTVSSASKFTREELHTFHTDLEDTCFKKFGKHKLVKNGKTKGNFSLQQLKEATAREEAIKQDYENQIALYREYLEKHNALAGFEKWLDKRDKQSDNQTQKEASIPVRETVVVQDTKQEEKERKQVSEVVTATQKPTQAPQKPVEAPKRDLSDYDPEEARRQRERDKRAIAEAMDWSDVNATTAHINSEFTR